MENKTICMSGMTDGLGKELIRLIAQKPNNFILLGRNESKLNDIKNMIKQFSTDSSIALYICDFSSLKEINEVAKSINEEYDKIDYLIHNVGSASQAAGQKTKEGIDFPLAVNYLAPLQLTEILIDKLNQSATPTIYYTTTQMMPESFSLSELDSLDTLSPMKSYAISKLLFCLYLEQLSRSTPFDIKIFDPTTMYTNTLAQGIPKGLRWAMPFAKLFVKSPEKVADSAYKILNHNFNRGISYYTLDDKQAPINVLTDKELQDNSTVFGKDLLKQTLN